MSISHSQGSLYFYNLHLNFPSGLPVHIIFHSNNLLDCLHIIIISSLESGEIDRLIRIQEPMLLTSDKDRGGRDAKCRCPIYVYIL